MTIKLGVVMDPIHSIDYKKDSTLAMLFEAQARGWEINYFEQQDLFLRDGVLYGSSRLLTVARDPQAWFKLGQANTLPISQLNVLLMRKDPPFDQTYLYTTYLLDHAESVGVLVVNRPQALRDANEKLFTVNFPQCTPPTLVTKSIETLHAFWQEQGDVICKPLNTMGGTSVFRLQAKDLNARVVFETLTHDESTYIMAQRFIPEIKQGDKRILLINGEPVPHALARIPQGADWRGNLAVGAKGVVQALSPRDRFICLQVGEELRKRGLYFVGLDVIGDYLTEINVTSPTGIREIDTQAGINVSAYLLDWIENAI